MDFNELRNNTSFNEELTKLFESIRKEDSEFYFHQRIIFEFFMKYSPRGILIYHKMGAGKSLSAAELCRLLEELGMSILFFSAKTLHENFKETLEKLQKMTGKDSHIEKFKFIALNASNMFTQVRREIAKLETLLDKKSENNINLNGKVVVVDEAHNFFNSIANGSENAQNFIKTIMKSKCKVIFLTGSPITNDPFEVTLCFNMLCGYLKDGSTLFPEDYAEYKDFLFMNKNKKTKKTGKTIKIQKIKNRTRFANRISGLVSYFGADDESMKKLLPKQLELVVEECEMSVLQYNQYTQARKIEQDVETLNYTPQAKKLTKDKASSSSYRVMSRQLCNFAFPEYALEKTHDNKENVVFKGNFDKLDGEDVVKNLKTYSPKKFKMFQNIEKIKGMHLVYSQFLTYGSYINELILQKKGYEKLNIHSYEGKKKRYTVITGETPKEEITDIMKILNSKENCYGDICSVILISTTASEGVDFHNLAAIHEEEPYWHWARMSQIFARGVRIGSHLDLPEKERIVQPFIYLSTQKTFNKELTTDEHIYRKARRNQVLIESFLTIIKSSSIDCVVHGYKDCRQCLPTNKKLFQNSLNLDVQTPDSCETKENKEVEAKLKNIDGITYAYYEKNNEFIVAKKLDNGSFEILEEPEKTIITDKIFL